MLSPLIDRVLYRPELTQAPRGETPAALGLNYEDVAFTAADGIRLTGWYVWGRAPRHALLYCHGNAGNRRDWVYAAPELVAAGCAVLVWDYRGYGDSQGRPSERGLGLDGEAAWGWLKARAARDGLPASILGKSLGSAVAIHLCATEQPRCLILDSAFASMREVVMSKAPFLPALAVPRRFESIERAAAIECPTLLLHGAQDALVPPEHAARLHAVVTAPKFLRLIPGVGHNDIHESHEYHNWIKLFLDDPPGLISEQSEDGAAAPAAKQV
jgi:fermentation-respiration switch protein FrsA (DUF1100 family)